VRERRTTVRRGQEGETGLVEAWIRCGHAQKERCRRGWEKAKARAEALQA
jgi:hypothetical protein